MQGALNDTDQVRTIDVPRAQLGELTRVLSDGTQMFLDIRGRDLVFTPIVVSSRVHWWAIVVSSRAPSPGLIVPANDTDGGLWLAKGKRGNCIGIAKLRTIRRVLAELCALAGFGVLSVEAVPFVVRVVEPGESDP